jgi:hypothetical protein
MRLEVFIADLLFDHDCVVVPDFGGLVANYRSARLNRISHELFPPSKHVGFNKNLIKNDGLLANHVASVLGISYKDALAKIVETVANYEVQLKRDGRISWEKIGVFFKDRSGQLQFIPDEQENFLTEAYGLSPIQLRPVLREEKIETPVVELISPSEKSRSNGWRVAAAVLIPLAIATYMFTAGPWREKGATITAGWNPFSSHQVTTAYQPAAQKARFDPEFYEIEDPFDFAVQNAGDSEEIIYNFQTDRPDAKGLHIQLKSAPAQPKEVVVTKEQTQVAVSAPVSNRKYAVIGGAFAINANAEKFINELKSQGYDAKMAGRKGELHLVAYGFYSTQNEADRALKNIRTTENKHAWLKKF